jgi:hypothetical protein
MSSQENEPLMLLMKDESCIEMTDKEFENLKPGDKVIAVESDDFYFPRTLKFQKENGGFLIVEAVYDLFSISIEGLGCFCHQEWLELYEEPNLPWSYEKDY